MKLNATLLAVRDMAAAVAFYRRVLGLRVTADFGANVTLSGGLCLQTLDSWRDFLEGAPVAFGGSDGEVYFQTEDFDAFAARLYTMDIQYVHGVKEHSWGQRAVRFRDPDGHIIEVGEPIQAVCRRFLASGLTPQQVAVRMDVPLPSVERWCR